MDMALSWEREASESLVQSRHSRGLLLGYLLAPWTGNLHFEEVVKRVLQENYKKHERAKKKSVSSLNKSLNWWAKLLEELDELSKRLDATEDKKAWKDVEERMGVIHTALEKVAASITQNEAHLEESQIQEDEVCYGDQGQSDSSEKSDSDIMVEPPEESGLPGVESTSHLSSQEMEPPMDVDMEGIPPLASDNTTVSAEEDQILTGDQILAGDQTHTEDQSPTSDTASMAGEMAKLQVSSPTCQEPEDGATSQ